eukprot:1160704-Pelagomonas_calceolata.AAC.12
MGHSPFTSQLSDHRRLNVVCGTVRRDGGTVGTLRISALSGMIDFRVRSQTGLLGSKERGKDLLCVACAAVTCSGAPESFI